MNIKISENIKRLRKAKKITQEGLAEIFNVTPAAVSKWENAETYPDITLLFPLSHFFGVSIDELMGYDHMIIEEEIKKVKEEIHNAWYVNNDWNKAKELTINAKLNYPNDYEIMVNYLFFTTGGMADNDPNVLLQNEKEIIKVCDLILEGCNVENYRLEAITYKAKVLYAKGDEQAALELLNNFPSFYHASGQRIEQLYQKGTKEYYNQLTLNLYELAAFVGNKLGKHISYDKKLLDEEKINKVDKLVELYNSISDDKDYDVLAKIIKDAIKEVMHRSKQIGFYNQEIEKINNKMKR
ncbi:MAG: helix-turn-helix transcriptional regulator [Bacilli bacterium]|nr:helix-turn-helix transcriptional regulator [Bacilli bacterium]